MPIPFIDLDHQHAPIRAAIDQAIAEVIDSGQFINGPAVEHFEAQIADYVGVAHAIGVSSGTDALLASLMALEIGSGTAGLHLLMLALGIGPGDEVITTPFSFCASAECILRVGARPVFVDIDPATFNLDATSLEEAVTDRTRAIIPVHLFGQCCEMAGVEAVAATHDLAIVEDAAQALGASYEGRKAGSMGDVGCFSFFPTKNLGAMGDGGLVTCRDDALAERIRTVCRHGLRPKYHQRRVGGNFRLDAVQAAVLAVKMEQLDTWIDERRANARRYDEALADIEGVTPPVEAEACRHTYNQYTVRVDGRDSARKRLTEAEVAHGIYYPLPLHRQDAYEHLDYEPDAFPEANRAAAEVVSLPVAVELTDVGIQRIAGSLEARKRRR